MLWNQTRIEYISSSPRFCFKQYTLATRMLNSISVLYHIHYEKFTTNNWQFNVFQITTIIPLLCFFKHKHVKSRMSKQTDLLTRQFLAEYALLGIQYILNSIANEINRLTLTVAHKISVLMGSAWNDNNASRVSNIFQFVIVLSFSNNKRSQD